ncbi:hypothetical protein BC829DRAFT_400513 [Chytridium lagenaria]|nr:hypothetical protein BC829DRAFT_400513 [Chytridium lagenaria]
MHSLDTMVQITQRLQRTLPPGDGKDAFETLHCNLLHISERLNSETMASFFLIVTETAASLAKFWRNHRNPISRMLDFMPADKASDDAKAKIGYLVASSSLLFRLAIYCRSYLQVLSLQNRLPTPLNNAFDKIKGCVEVIYTLDGESQTICSPTNLSTKKSRRHRKPFHKPPNTFENTELILLTDMILVVRVDGFTKTLVVEPIPVEADEQVVKWKRGSDTVLDLRIKEKKMKFYETVIKRRSSTFSVSRDIVHTSNSIQCPCVARSKHIPITPPSDFFIDTAPTTPPSAAPTTILIPTPPPPTPTAAEQLTALAKLREMQRPAPTVKPMENAHPVSEKERLEKMKMVKAGVKLVKKEFEAGIKDGESGCKVTKKGLQMVDAGIQTLSDKASGSIKDENMKKTLGEITPKEGIKNITGVSADVNSEANQRRSRRRCGFETRFSSLGCGKIVAELESSSQVGYLHRQCSVMMGRV